MRFPVPNILIFGIDRIRLPLGAGERYDLLPALPNGKVTLKRALRKRMRVRLPPLAIPPLTPCSEYLDLRDALLVSFLEGAGTTGKAIMGRNTPLGLRLVLERHRDRYGDIAVDKPRLLQGVCHPRFESGLGGIGAVRVALGVEIGAVRVVY